MIRRSLILTVIGVTWSIAVPTYAQTGPRTLALEERVACQSAIEAVYWRHRIWPKENLRPKPELEEAVPLTTIQAKVEDYLQKSQALEVYWQRPITGLQLQAEIDRMTRQTKQPPLLRELWAALGNDPYTVAECLARPVLTDRLVRNRYAFDKRRHGELRSRAETELLAHRTASSMRQLGGDYLEVEWTRNETGAQPFKSGTVVVNSVEWAAKIQELSRLFESGTDLRDLPTGTLSRLQEDSDRFYVAAVLGTSNSRLKVAIVEWRKTPFDAWWGTVRERMHGQLVTQQYPYRLDRLAARPSFPGFPALSGLSDVCADDDWTPLPAPLVSARYLHSAVWTGSEMIIWGGTDGSRLETGWRYDPATDTWAATALRDAPRARIRHTAVWTGSEMIVWGGVGENFFDPLNTGGRYDPATDTWSATTFTASPSARFDHTAIWTGTEMIVWGGFSFDTGSVNTGGRYDPATDTWTDTTMTDAPDARDEHSAVWTGSEMIVWGGLVLNSGGRYDPAADAWTSTSTTDAPSGRHRHTAVWTGGEMIVWGGATGSALSTGGRYDPATDTWTATDMTDAPGARTEHTAVWTGAEMIVWGGDALGPPYFLDTGGRYDPATNSWTATDVTTAPSARSQHTAVWSGAEMIIWGGGEGGRYDPATDSWTSTNTTTAPPSARVSASAVWTGAEMIVWGGSGLSTDWNTGARYDPAIDNWTATTTTSAPTARDGHTAVWTGLEMIVWGGGAHHVNFGTTYENTGGRYDPAADSWTDTDVTKAPTARAGHAAIWTGSEMIVAMGNDDSSVFNTGGRYDPSTDSWTATSVTDAPRARTGAPAVWTGSEMILWGGTFGSHTGGRYDPATDTWSATNATNAPHARVRLTAVWTGNEMVVWGGILDDGGGPLSNSGGRYDPLTDSWTDTDVTMAPDARFGHTTVWTGSEMIVWGGAGNSPTYFKTGGRYDPATNTWMATNAATAPGRRYEHTAVWTGDQMIVWGGTAGGSLFDTGSRYCASGADMAKE